MITENFSGKSNPTKDWDKVIIIVEGGLVQNVYSPNPNIKLECIILDYDVVDFDGVKRLVESLQKVDTAEERKFGYQPSSQKIFQEKRLLLQKLSLDM